jgi:dihydroorotase-like cyclic amidohydrolase
MIAKVRVYDFDWCKKQVAALVNLYDTQNNQLIVAKMKEIVPEFISQNSVFEELDYKHKSNIETITKHSYLS